jgi:pyridoxal phosphate enzyme (YggS family)
MTESQGHVPEPLTVEAVAPRVEALRRRIDAASGGRPVEIVAVTKGFGSDAVRAAVGSGLTRVGENYAQELIAKASDLADSPSSARPEWHFLGRLQRNKVRQLAPIVDVWQSVDRAELVDEIAKRSPGAVIFIQANLSGEEQKGGANLAEIPSLVARAVDSGLVVTGLMGVGPAGDPELARPGFRALVTLADRLSLPERSIGMSADLEVAIEEGATLVRVGHALFGDRPPR